MFAQFRFGLSSSTDSLVRQLQTKEILIEPAKESLITPKRDIEGAGSTEPEIDNPDFTIALNSPLEVRKWIKAHGYTGRFRVRWAGDPFGREVNWRITPETPRADGQTTIDIYRELEKILEFT